MAKRRAKRSAVVGVADHCGWAILMTVAADGQLIDRRRVELVAPNLPSLPHHHEGQMLPLPRAVELVERVRASADTLAAERLDALTKSVPLPITGITLRRYPPLPPSIAERITDYRAQCAADSVMYRDALAGAAQARGWSVDWYDPQRVLADAARALGRDDIHDLLESTRAALGPPWQKDHRVAMAAAIAFASAATSA